MLSLIEIGPLVLQKIKKLYKTDEDWQRTIGEIIWAFGSGKL